jgi:large subunit ribosomal protein L22
MSARKARVVADHIRGRSVPEARTLLAFTPRAAAREIEKVLKSAVANAEANHNARGDELVVSAAYVDEGPTIKRWRARARRLVSDRVLKRTCHITVKVAPVPTRCQAPLREKPKRARRSSPERRPRPSQRRRASAPHDPKKTTSGPKSSSRRDARGRHPRLEVELVDGQEGFPEVHCRGRQIREHIYRKLSHAGLSRHPDHARTAADHRGPSTPPARGS